MQAHRSEVFSGPLPPPDKFQGYEQVLPGAAERILKMAEEQAAHRREIEKIVINSDVANSRRGMYFGLIVAIVALAGGAYLISNGKTIEGGVFGGTPLATLVGVFVYGSWQRRKERSDNKKLLQDQQSS